MTVCKLGSALYSHHIRYAPVRYRLDIGAPEIYLILSNSWPKDGLNTSVLYSTVSIQHMWSRWKYNVKAVSHCLVRGLQGFVIFIGVVFQILFHNYCLVYMHVQYCQFTVCTPSPHATAG